MSVENKLAVYKSGDVDALWSPVCAMAEWRYFSWFAYLLATNQRLEIQEGLMVDRKLNLFRTNYARKDGKFGACSLILTEFEIPVLALSPMTDEEWKFWFEGGVTFHGFGEQTFSIAVREFWGNPVTASDWHNKEIRAAIEDLSDTKLRKDLKNILKRRDDHWMQESIKLLLSKLEKVEVS